MLTHISLFAGIGCESIAAEWAGFKTILHCEIDPDCQKVLRKHWPDVPIIGDVRDVKKESVIANTECSTIAPQTKGWQEQINQNGRDIRCVTSSGNRTGITLLTAGVPCQPASSAGKRRGKADVRWLWPEAIRVLSELQPTWAVFENPVGIASLVESSEDVSMGSPAYQSDTDYLSVELSNIISDIEAKGYTVQPVSISAASVGAPHKRQRIFIVCHTRSCGLSRESRRRSGEKSQDGCVGNESTITDSLNQRGNGSIEQPAGSPGLAQCDSDVADTHQLNGDDGGLPASQISQFKKTEISGLPVDPDSQKQGLERPESEGNCGTNGLFTELGSYPGWQQNWIEVAQRLCSKTQPGVRSMDARPAAELSGLNLSRTAKLKMLGNCNPPQMYYPIFKVIAEVEKGVNL